MNLAIRNISILYLAAMISILGNLAVAEGGDPVSIKQLNFDLAPTAVKEIAEIKFSCAWKGHFCINDGTEVFLMDHRAGKVNLMIFLCDSFNGCGFSQNELKESLEKTYSLNFENIDKRLHCGKTKSTLHTLCLENLDFGEVLELIYEFPGHSEYNLSTIRQACATTTLGAKICLQGNTLLFWKSKFKQTTDDAFWE